MYYQLTITIFNIINLRVGEQPTNNQIKILINESEKRIPNVENHIKKKNILFTHCILHSTNINKWMR